ncbi:uncharacterized protein LOC105837890 [Monomorium pharaonis]|uniref:uncharacterized protein LOC105837890 n=1 Tax=Monomorium pharaonis TaxID=307658 RepID=UPI001745C8D9|nr:uncharacterized protein LOC105837890 [Monomorium pharaonis]XP_036142449.1 uncharacterized protein LOC105837890 [Monomorium pharaonis]
MEIASPDCVSLCRLEENLATITRARVTLRVPDSHLSRVAREISSSGDQRQETWNPLWRSESEIGLSINVKTDLEYVSEYIIIDAVDNARRYNVIILYVCHYILQMPAIRLTVLIGLNQ